MNLLINSITYILCFPLMVLIFIFYGEWPTVAHMMYAFPFTFPVSIGLWAFMFFCASSVYLVLTNH